MPCVALLHKRSRRRYVCQSRCVTNKPKRRYRIRNWRDYNSALVRRGSLALRVEQRSLDKWREQRARVGRGRRRTCSDAAVLRGREVGRSEWKKEAGYHRRSLAETAMMRFKTAFSDRLKAGE